MNISQRSLIALSTATVALLGTPVGADAAAGHVAAPAGRVARALSAVTGIPGQQLTLRRGCGPARWGYATCDAWAVAVRRSGRLMRPRVSAGPATGQAREHALRPGATASGTASTTITPTDPTLGTPAYLQAAYDLTALSLNAGSAKTIGIVDAGPYATAASDLATYRARFDLPACTTASGCLTILNENGGSTPPPALPSSFDPSEWVSEQALDLDAVSALCPNCHIVLVQTNSSNITDLDTGVTAAVNAGATQVSLSWGAAASSPDGGDSFGNVPIIAASGDSGYPGNGMAQYPAAFSNVTAAGATTLTPAANARGFTESAWSLDSPGDNSAGAGGSGCSTAVARPAWQSASTGCSGRAYADVSADGNPYTGLDVYNTANGGWSLWGGTSLSSPLIAAFEAVTGVGGDTAQWAYAAAAGLLNDPVGGSNGSCPTMMLDVCNAGVGWDGPTGVGSVSGAAVSGAPGIGGADSQGAAATSDASATLTDGLWANQQATSYSYQYGPTTAYGGQSAPATASAGGQPQSVSATLSGLTPGTTYHYRLVAANADGTTYGPDATFSTPPAPARATPPPTTTTTTTPTTPTATSTTAPSSGAGATTSSGGVATASGGGGTGNTGAGLSALRSPAINGVTAVGWALHVTCGEWAEPWAKCSVQWQRAKRRGAFRDIRGGRRRVLVLIRADRGWRVRAVVTVEAVGGRLRGTAPSNTVGPVKPGR